MAKKKSHFAARQKITVAGPSIKNGREVWRISVDGKQRSVSTSASSIAAMDEAMKRYSGALKRLADK
jgi:hypothetical protein